MKNYWNDTEHFADLFNTVCFHGKSVIQSQDLYKAPTELLHINSGKVSRKSTSFYRDVVMKYHKSGITLALLTVESQSKIHYAMPIRSLFYDALTYYEQWRDLKRKHRKSKELMTDEEFLSGMKESDRFTPVISIVFYHGENPWHWPKSLHDILNIPPGWEPYVKNYTLNLVDAGKCNLNFSDTDNQDFFQLLSILYDENVSVEQRKENALSYCDRNSVTGEVLTAVCASSSKNKIEFPNKKDREVTHMCKVFDAEREAGRAEGRAEGHAEGHAAGRMDGNAEQIVKIYQKLQKSNNFILNQLIAELSISTEKANEYLVTYGT